MSPKMQAFCDAYLANGGNATQAAITAGYSATTAGAQGSRLLKNVDIKNYLEGKQEKRVKEAKGRIAGADEVLAFFTATMRNAKHGIKDRLKAASELKSILDFDTRGDYVPDNRIIIELVDMGVISNEN